MEDKIIQEVSSAISKAIQAELIGYNKPLSRIVCNVIDSHEEEITALVDADFVSFISNPTFRETLKDALNKSLSKSLVSRFGGELEKRVNRLKADPITRAKIDLAIDKVIREL